MVCASELAFRLQCRKRSQAKVCFTPMTHARLFSESEKYRKEMFNTCPEDRPLIVQFCGNDPATLLRAAKFVENDCDGIDINLGCPQGIARKGKYGSFLLEHTELLVQIVQTLTTGLSIPVSCKIRIVPGPLENTVNLCKQLESAGCEMLTVHGRRREENKDRVSACNWDIIKLVKESVSIPVVANGGIASVEDQERCLLYTGVDAVMSCEAVLENPSLFGPSHLALDPFSTCLEYLQLAKDFPDCGQVKPARGHLFRFLFSSLRHHPEFYAKIGQARGLEDMRVVVEELHALHHHPSSDTLPCKESCSQFNSVWYLRHQTKKTDDDEVGGTREEEDFATNKREKTTHDDDV